MDAHKAAELINNNVTFMPGWDVGARGSLYEDLFNSTPEVYEYVRANRDGEFVTLTVEAVVRDSNYIYAPDYRDFIISGWTKVLNVQDLTEEQLYAEVLRFLIGHLIHEAREFFSTDKQTYHKPFHPHTFKGKQAWNVYDFPTH